MKKILIIVACCLMVLLVSCVRTDNYGYPGSVSFGKEGGVKTVEGEDYAYNLEIRNSHGDGASNRSDSERGDSIIVSYEWLTVESFHFGYRWTLIAQPNTTGRKRTLYVSGLIDDGFAEVKVTQSP